jgi:hypothetical protein
LSRFEYLSVLVSIVIALGITEVTISWSRLLQLRRRVTFSWLHAFWTIFMLFLMIQFWWDFWNFRLVESWSLLSLFGVVAPAITLVLAALLLTPRGIESGPANLGTMYFSNSRLFFLLGAALMLQLTVVDTLVTGRPFAVLENLFRVPGIAIALFAAFSTSVRVHNGLALLALLLLAGYVGSTIEP